MLLRGQIIGLFATASILVTAAPAATARDLVIGGASVTGVYYQVAKQICMLVNKYAADRYNCLARPTLGSVYNINAVDRGRLDLAVTQSDRNYQAWHGEGDWTDNAKAKLRSIFSVHPEMLYLMVRRDANISSVEDLRGKTVNIGNRGSGQRGMALDVLRLYGIDKDRDIQARGLQQSAVEKALVGGEIDAFFYSVGLGAAAIEGPANGTDANLIKINSDAVKAFVASKPFYNMTVIPAGSYRGTEQDVETFGFKATMVAHADAPDHMIRDVVAIVFEHLDELKTTHPAFATLTKANMLEGLTAPLHSAAMGYYKDSNLR